MGLVPYGLSLKGFPQSPWRQGGTMHVIAIMISEISAGPALVLRWYVCVQ